MPSNVQTVSVPLHSSPIHVGVHHCNNLKRRLHSEDFPWLCLLILLYTPIMGSIFLSIVNHMTYSKVKPATTPNLYYKPTVFLADPVRVTIPKLTPNPVSSISLFELTEHSGCKFICTRQAYAQRGILEGHCRYSFHLSVPSGWHRSSARLPAIGLNHSHENRYRRYSSSTSWNHIHVCFRELS